MAAKSSAAPFLPRVNHIASEPAKAHNSRCEPAGSGRAKNRFIPASLSMKELLRTNNSVRLSWAQAVLADAGIDCLVLDHHTSLVEGNIGAIPRRLMVAERDYRRARESLAAAEAELP